MFILYMKSVNPSDVSKTYFPNIYWGSGPIDWENVPKTRLERKRRDFMVLEK